MQDYKAADSRTIFSSQLIIPPHQMVTKMDVHTAPPGLFHVYNEFGHCPLHDACQI